MYSTAAIACAHTPTHRQRERERERECKGVIGVGSRIAEFVWGTLVVSYKDKCLPDSFFGEAGLPKQHTNYKAVGRGPAIWKGLRPSVEGSLLNRVCMPSILWGCRLEKTGGSRVPTMLSSGPARRFLHYSYCFVLVRQARAQCRLLFRRPGPSPEKKLSSRLFCLGMRRGGGRLH